MMKYILSITFTLLITSFLLGQNKKLDVECGDKLESTLNKKKEKQDFYIELEAGDNLKIYSSAKFGDYLKYHLDFFDPNGNRLKSWHLGTHIYQVETDLLPATGKYYLRVSGYKAIGDYVIEFVCEKSNGEIIDNNGSGVISEKMQFLSVPLGTPFEGEIKSGSNQLFGFKTKIDRNAQATLDFAIIEGNAPLDIQIYDSSDNSIIFYSSLGYANSQQTLITFPKPREYIISIKESSSSNKKGGVTKFKVILK